MVVGERLQSELEPPVRGYLNAPPSRELQAAHWNHPGLHVLDATLEMLETIGWSRIHERVDALAGGLQRRLGAAGFEVVTPAHARAGIVVARVQEPIRVAERLDALGIRVEPRGAGIRASTHFYNSHEDGERLAEALAAVAQPSH